MAKKNNWFPEKIILKKAKVVIFNTQETKEGYIKLKTGININEKSFVIPNPLLLRRIVNPLYFEKDKKVMIYAGNFYGKRRLNYIFEPL